MEFVQKSLLVINRSNQQLLAMMNLDPDFGQCLLLVTNEEDVSSQCLLYPDSCHRWKRKALNLQHISTWKKHHCYFSVA